MRASVDFENVIVEVFHAEAQARHAEFADGAQLVFRQRAGLAFEGDFLNLIPWQHRFHAIGEMFQLIDREIRWSAAAEINESWLASADEWPRCVQGHLLQ